MKEQWRPVPGFPDYEVSDRGNVISFAKAKAGRTYHPYEDNLGYKWVDLHRNGYVKRDSVHRLVLLAFVGPCPRGLEGCHNNGHPDDCRLSNLRYDTRVNNLADKYKHGTVGRPWLGCFGDRNPHAKLTYKKVAEIKRLYGTGKWKMRELGRKFDVTATSICEIVNGKRWSR